jgi:hypothetical protein
MSDDETKGETPMGKMVDLNFSGRVNEDTLEWLALCLFGESTQENANRVVRLALERGLTLLVQEQRERELGSN